MRRWTRIATEATLYVCVVALAAVVVPGHNPSQHTEVPVVHVAATESGDAPGGRNERRAAGAPRGRGSADDKARLQGFGPETLFLEAGETVAAEPPSSEPPPTEPEQGFEERSNQAVNELTETPAAAPPDREPPVDFESVLRAAAAASTPPPAPPEPASWLSYVGMVAREGTQYHYFKNNRTGRVIEAVAGRSREGYRLSRWLKGTFVLSWNGRSYLVGKKETQ